MFAKISRGKNIMGILLYNEQKVEKEQASVLIASNSEGEVERMSMGPKNYRFVKLNKLNPSVKTNALHFTHNFHPTDKLDAKKLQAIVSEYMEQITEKSEIVWVKLI